jgi:ribose transport system substrate-binding protein
MKLTTAVSTLIILAFSSFLLFAETPLDSEMANIRKDFATLSSTGIRAVPVSVLKLTPAEIAKVKAMNLKVAWLFGEESAWSKGIQAGSEKAIAELNMKLAFTADAQFDVAKQKTDIENALAIRPDIMLSLVVDPVVEAEAYRQAVKAGVKLAFIDELPEGFQQPKDYIGVVSSDLVNLGKGAAEMLASAMGGKGKIGFMYYDTKFHNTNMREAAFKYIIQTKYPNIQIVAEQGITDADSSGVAAAAMITQHPEITGLFSPWDGPAEAVVAACRAAKRPDIKVVTFDFGAANALDMVKGGNVAGIVVDDPFMMGYSLIILGAYGYLGKASPAFLMVNATKADAKNVVDVWRKVMGADPAPEIIAASKR